MSSGRERRSAEDTLVILHSADLHNRLKPEAARRLAELRAAEPNCLLLDAGDAVAAGNLTYRPGGEPILKTMAEIGYQAMTMGNRESHPRRWFLERKLKDAAFPVLAANLVAEDVPAPEVVKPYVVLPAGGLQVGVIGPTREITKSASALAGLTDYVWRDPVEAAAEFAEEIRDRVDLVILLSHCGLTVDRKLAALPGVNLVLGGHSHVETIERGDGAPIVHPGAYGRLVSRSEFRGRELVNVELVSLEAER